MQILWVFSLVVEIGVTSTKVEMYNFVQWLHLNNKEKEFFYEKRADALGVRKHGDRSNDRSLPTQEEHAEAMGVGALVPSL